MRGNALLPRRRESRCASGVMPWVLRQRGVHHRVAFDWLACRIVLRRRPCFRTNDGGNRTSGPGVRFEYNLLRGGGLLAEEAWGRIRGEREVIVEAGERRPCSRRSAACLANGKSRGVWSGAMLAPFRASS